MLFLFVVSCKDTKTNELSSAQTEKTEDFKYEFITEEKYIRIGYLDDLSTINKFDEYFIIKNNIVIEKSSLTPFEGKITILYEEPGSEKMVRELYFTNGLLHQLDWVSYNKYGNLNSKVKYNIFTYFNNDKKMIYYYKELERYDYFDIHDDVGAIENNLEMSGIASARIAGNHLPEGFYKFISYTKSGEKNEEGYYQRIHVPVYDNYLKRVELQYGLYPIRITQLSDFP